jgi:hypothetical protein
MAGRSALPGRYLDALGILAASGYRTELVDLEPDGRRGELELRWTDGEAAYATRGDVLERDGDYAVDEALVSIAADVRAWLETANPVFGRPIAVDLVYDGAAA